MSGANTHEERTFRIVAPTPTTAVNKAFTASHFLPDAIVAAKLYRVECLEHEKEVLWALCNEIEQERAG